MALPISLKLSTCPEIILRGKAKCAETNRCGFERVRPFLRHSPPRIGPTALEGH